MSEAYKGETLAKKSPFVSELGAARGRKRGYLDISSAGLLVDVFFFDGRFVSERAGCTVRLYSDNKAWDAHELLHDPPFTA